MKQNLLKCMTVAAVMGASTLSAMAQTDVTSQYVSNPSFENDGKVIKSPSGSSHTISVDGWVMPTIPSGTANMNIEGNNGDTNSAFGKSSSKEGNYHFFNRWGWCPSNPETLTLSTESKTELPEGIYKLSVSYKACEFAKKSHRLHGSTLAIRVMQNENDIASTNKIAFHLQDRGTNDDNGNVIDPSYFTNTEWSSLELPFYIKEIGTAKFCIDEKLMGGVRADLLLDNLILTYYDLTKTSLESSFDMTMMVNNPTFDSNTNGWTSTTGASSNKLASNKQGDFTGNFYENWNKDPFKGEIYQELNNIPNGTYSLKIAAFRQGTSEDKDVVSVFANEDKTMVISTEPTYYTVVTYVTNGKMKFGLQEEEATYNWVGIDNASLTYYGKEDVTEAVKVNLAKEKLAGIISNAPDPKTNVGEGVFQIPATEAEKLSNVINEANVACANGTTLEGITAAISTLNAAIETYRNAQLNAPKAGEVFNIICAANVDWKGKAVTFKDGNSTEGTYGMSYTEDAQSVYNQTVTLKQVEGQLNCYNMSITEADGTIQYVATQKAAYNTGDDLRLRATTDPLKALAIKIVATDKEGIYNMYNTVTNGLIGNGDSGFYTGNTNADVRIVPAEKLNVTLDITDAGWATIILPFDADKQDGIEAIYSYESTTGTTINLKAEDSFKANTPYLVKGAARTYDFEGYGAAKTASYTAGRFVGALVANTVNAPKGSYILQKQDEGLGFYLVDTEEGAMMNQYRVYLTAEENSDTSNEVKAFFFGTDDATAINGLTNAEGVKETARYNAAGVKVNAPVKGINIVKMSDGSVKKVIVK